MYYNIHTQQIRKALPRPLYWEDALQFDPTGQDYINAGWYPYAPATPPDGEYITEAVVTVIDGVATQQILQTAPLPSDLNPGTMPAEQIYRHVLPQRRLQRFTMTGLTYSTGPVLDLELIGEPLQACWLSGASEWSSAERIAVILGAGTLGNLSNVGTQSAFSCMNHNLSAEALNQFFEDLPSTTNQVTLSLAGNPGSDTCDPEIATAKGYTVNL